MVIATLTRLPVGAAEAEPKECRKPTNTDDYRESEKKQHFELWLSSGPQGKVFLEVDGKGIEANVLLDSGANVFIIPPLLSNYEKSRKWNETSQ